MTMQLKRPFAEFLRMQNQSYGEPLMISPEAVQTHGNEGFAQNPVGTGRFKLVERKEGESTTIVRFADYWGADKALLDKVIFRVIPDSQAAISALKAGETDMMLLDPARQPPRSGEQRFHHLDERRPVRQVLVSQLQERRHRHQGDPPGDEHGVQPPGDRR